MEKVFFRRSFFGLLILLFCVTFVLGISSTNYAINSPTVSEGASGNISSENYLMGAVLGEVAGTTNSSSQTLSLGFWYSAISNEAPNTPEVLLNFSGTTNRTAQNVMCTTTTSDPDGDDLNVTVRWYLNGTLDSEYNYTSIANGTLYSAILLSGNTTKRDNWSCDMRFYDGQDYSSFSDISNNGTVLNSPPTVAPSSPANNSETYDRTPLFEWVSNDDDGDVLEYDWNLSENLVAGGAFCSDQRQIESITSLNYTPTSDLSCLYVNGYNYIWKVRVYDGEAYSPWSGEYYLNISANLSIDLTVDTIDFGSLDIWSTNDTTDNNPAPLIIENTGNVVVNVTVNSSNLFDTQVDNSSYFQMKIDNKSGEVGAFSFVDTLMSWFNVPITGNLLAISQLNYTDSNDSAEIDFYVDSPFNESPGEKTATVVFTSRLAE